MLFINKLLLETLVDTETEKNSVPSHIAKFTLQPHLKEFSLLNYLIIPKVEQKKFDKSEIDVETLKASYFRALEAIQPHEVARLIKGKILICDCESVYHTEHCPSMLLKEFISRKNFKLVQVKNDKAFKRAVIKL